MIYVYYQQYYFKVIKIKDNFVLCTNNEILYKFPLSLPFLFFNISSQLNINLIKRIFSKLESFKKQYYFTLINSEIFNNIFITSLISNKITQKNLEEKAVNGKYCWDGLKELHALYVNVNHLADTSLMLYDDDDDNDDVYNKYDQYEIENDF